MPLSTSESIGYALDALKSSSSGMLITKEGCGYDLTGYSKVNGFQVLSEQPSGTLIRFLFNTSDSPNWFKLTESGKAMTITTETPSYEITAEKGNAVSRLNSLTNVPALAGKKVRVAIALGSSDIENAVPKVKFSFKVQNSTQVLKKTELSPEYAADTECRIDRISYEPSVSGDAAVNVYASLKDSSGSWSSWQEASSVSGAKCTGARLKAEYSVNSVGSGTASLSNARIIYTDGKSIILGNASGEIYSWTQDWYMNIRHCRMKVRHSVLADNSIECYVCFRDKPHEVRNETLGIGSGRKSVYQLGHSDGVRYDSVRLFYDGERISSGYEVNTETARISCTAPEGTVITVSYEYGWGFEEWRKMNVSLEESYDDYDLTEYRYSRPDDESAKSVCAVKLALKTESGSVKKEIIGTGTGKSETYMLSHRVSDGEITITDSGTALPEKSYALLDDTRFVRIAGASGHTLKASYNWVSESPVIYQFAAVFSE